MSQVLTVPTHFNDIGELSEGFLDRVEQDTLILYGPVAYEEGSEIEFGLLLADGTAALEGVGRVRAAVDGGDDRVPETRYDIVVEALELDGRSEVVFERLVIARQAVSDAPPAEDDEPAVHEMNAAHEESEPVTVPPEGEEPDTVPPEAYDEEEEEPATVVTAVDAEAMMAEALGAAAAAAGDAAAGADADTISGEDVGYDVEEFAYEHASEPAPETQAETASESEPEDEPATDAEVRQDSMYAFEHGIASEPRVGMPVPIPSMAAPPEAPPAPPTLRLAEPPQGLTRPSLAQPEDPLFSVDGEVSDVHTTGLFAYEDGLPIPSRPPLPDPNRAKQVAKVEAANDYHVEDSEPPELLADDYEEVRLSDFAEAAEEG